jgi:hypothetical protein
MAPDEKPSENRSSVTRLSLIVTASALVLMGFHIAWPDANIDATTIALLALALLPWLAPLVKTIDVGGVKFELQDFRREVTQNLAENRERVDVLADRVDKLAIAFSGAVTPELEQQLSSQLDSFHTYLAERGIPLPPAPPAVAIDDGLVQATEAISTYDDSAQCIHIDSAYADDPDLILREYTHHVLFAPPHTQPDGAHMTVAAWERYAVESALADYFPASFRNDSVLYRKTATRLGDRWDGTDLGDGSRFPRRRPTTFAMSRTEAKAWGAVFWRTRAVAGPDVADALLYQLWTDADTLPIPEHFRATAAHLLAETVAERVSESAGTAVTQALEERGLRLKA